jgi:hypothetical protein
LATTFALVAGFAIAIASPAFAQPPAAAPGPPPGTMPTYESPVVDGGAPAASPAHTSTHRKTTTKHHSKSSKSESSAIEPAEGHLKLLEDSPAYDRPSKTSKKVAEVHAGKFVNVTGTSRYYAQVKLKTGETAFVPMTAIQLVTPTDKSFQLTSDAEVLASPNHAAKKVAEVHKGKNVHVVGVALSYMKIQMKDGTEGFIPISALQ